MELTEKQADMIERLKHNIQEYKDSLKSITFKIVGAKNLWAADKGGTSDPYVVVEGAVDKFHKTEVKKKNLNPEWNETFVVDLEALVVFMPKEYKFMVYDHNDTELGFATLSFDMMINLAYEAKKEDKSPEIAKTLKLMTPNGTEPTLDITFQFNYKHKKA